MVGICGIDAVDTFSRQAMVVVDVSDPVDVFDVVKCKIIFDTNKRCNDWPSLQDKTMLKAVMTLCYCP